MRANRRQFITATLGSSAVISLGSAVPQFLLDAAARESRQPTDETILVVVQLSGGNDGLNTVVPYEDDAYYRSRPQLGIGKGQVLKIDQQLGLHPSLSGMSELMQEGQLTIVQGVGYPQPNRSHFESMDIWHTCRRKTELRADGWLGRYLDAVRRQRAGEVPALHLGSEKQPLAVVAQHVRVPSVQSLERFRLQSQPRVQALLREIASTERSSDNDLLQFVQSTNSSALQASSRVEQSRRQYKPKVEYPTTGLGQKLRTVAQLVDAGLGARIYYVTLDGFDTHARQADAHAALLNQLSGAIHAFVKDVSAHGHGERVLVCSFSEFGRRLKENASAGTDHGAAAPVLLAGERVKGGVIGRQPSLTDLQDGDLKFHTDFRRVYASILENWLDWPSEKVLGGSYKPLDLFA